MSLLLCVVNDVVVEVVVVVVVDDREALELWTVVYVNCIADVDFLVDVVTLHISHCCQRWLLELMQ